MTIRLAHFSDIHLGPLPPVRKRELFSKRVTGYVNWKRHRGRSMGGREDSRQLSMLLEDWQKEAPNLTAITGDLVNIATPAEITNVKLWLDRFFDPANTMLVPGNHDAYVPGALARACVEWAPFLHFSVGIGPHYFPTLFREQQISLIGVSTARATIPFSAEGFFRKRQADKLAQLLTGEKGRCRVVLIHHPPLHGATSPHKRLRGIGRFQKIIAEYGAELVLHGHTHLPTLNWIEGVGSEKVPVVGVASASQNEGGRKPSGNYSIFEISETGEAGNFRIVMERRGLKPEQNAITCLERQILR